MAATESHDVELGNTGYEIFVGALSVLSLVNIVLLAVLPDPSTQQVVFVTNLPEAQDMCRVGWEVNYDPSRDDTSARESIEMVYSMMADWLAEAAREPRR